MRKNGMQVVDLGEMSNVSLFAEARARHALDAAGFNPDTPLEQASSVTNEVWLGREVVVRVNSVANYRLRREADLAQVLPKEVGYPEILAYGGDLGADYLILRRVPGQPLSRWWPNLTRDQRRAAISELASKLRAIHSTIAPPTPELTSAPQLLHSARHGNDAVIPLLNAIDKVQTLPHIDRGLIRRVRELVEASAGYLDPFDTPTLVHGDLTFENVLWDGTQISAVLDFEWSRSGPPDLDLDVLLRFCAYPYLHVAADYEDRTHVVDYADVPWWLAADYPDLFDAPYVFDRVRLYSIAWDVRELLAFPPKGEPRELHSDHPYHRLRQMLSGSGYLDRLNGGTSTQA